MRKRGMTAPVFRSVCLRVFFYESLLRPTWACVHLLLQALVEAVRRRGQGEHVPGPAGVRVMLG